MSITQRPELLSPAGDQERLEAAVLYGADAVYLGGKMFGMRASPQNFDPEALAEAVRFCHERDVNVYLTCNTLPTNADIDRLPEFFNMAKKSCVDALIVADIGVLMAARRACPDMDIHISTQAGVVNYLAANELHALGANRVVLARELSLEDIALIREKTPPSLEIEAFVHGAMCMSFSGRCLISQYLTARDANHGACAQPCRWAYHLMEEKRPGQFFPVFQDSEGSYILNARDLSMLAHIDKLAQAGVGSFKIEGRAKSAYYVAVVTNAYRCAIDLYKKNPMSFEIPEWLVNETRKVSHRQYSTGFYFSHHEPGQYYESGGYVREWDVAAIVEDWRDDMIICSERNRFFTGDMLEILEPGKIPVPLPVTKIYDMDGKALNAARKPMEKIAVPHRNKVIKGAIIRKIKEI
ncbi:MAG: U32 family peptidase [Oscillospiraceae bacterium]|nr:U32 family peptidase [Oscillospiraceae bacterium]